MSTLETHVRGATIGFYCSAFHDEYGASVIPTAVTLRIVYPLGATTVTTTVAMDITGATAKKSWDSSVSDAGQVDWFITDAASTKPAAQGSFILLANNANPAPA